MGSQADSRQQVRFRGLYRCQSHGLESRGGQVQAKDKSNRRTIVHASREI